MLKFWDASFEYPQQMFKLMDKKIFSILCSNFLLISQPKTKILGTQKNRLNETVSLSIKNKCLNWYIRKNLNFTLQNFVFSYFSAKAYVVGTQKDCLNPDNETVVLITHNKR